MTRRNAHVARSKGAIVAIALASACCSRRAGFTHDDVLGGSRLDPDASPAPTSVPTESAEPPSQARIAPPASGEARRSVLASLDAAPAARPFLKILRDHFAAASGPFEMQQIGLAGGRAALLLSRPNEAEPIVLVVDRDVLAWAKSRPLAGIKPPALHVAMAPRPDGGVALFVYVASLHIVAARMWADDGNPYAEIELASFDTCDALSAAYASGVGWIVACASTSGTRAQRLREDGTTIWGHEGRAIGAQTAAGPATVAFDTPETWMVLQRDKGAGMDHLFAWRYDMKALPLWTSPVDLGALPAKDGPLETNRIEASAEREGAVRVAIARGLPGKNAKAVDVASNGDVRVIDR